MARVLTRQQGPLRGQAEGMEGRGHQAVAGHAVDPLPGGQAGQAHTLEAGLGSRVAVAPEFADRPGNK